MGLTALLYTGGWFEALRSQMDEPIQEKMEDTRRKLLEHFDEEVQEKLKISKVQSRAARDRYQEWLWLLTRQYLKDHAEFQDGDERSFTLKENPFPGESIPPGPYCLGPDGEDVNRYRLGHPLAQRIIDACKGLEAQAGHIVFQLGNIGRKVAAVEPFIGQSGWLAVELFTLEALEAEDHLLAVGWTDGGDTFDEDQVRRLFGLPATFEPMSEAIPAEKAEAALQSLRQQRLADLERKNSRYFDEELEKLDHWADDRKQALEFELKELERSMKEARRAGLAAPTLEEKLHTQRRFSELETLRNKKRRELYEAQDAIEAQRNELIQRLEARLQRQQASKALFCVRWTVA